MSIPLDATVVDAAALADDLARTRIVPAERLNELLGDYHGDGGAAGLAEFLVATGALTPFQAQRVLAGDAQRLIPGPYRITGIHRIGTLGPVYRAVHRTKPGAFALKLLPLRNLWQARQAKQLPRSFGRLASHPRLAALVDADSAKGIHYLVWPLTDDDLLADRVKQSGPLSPTAVAAMLEDLAEALAAIHSRKLVHGLLSARSVGLLADDRARLLEFGAGQLLAANLALDDSLFDTLSTSLAVAEMLDFAAPELLADPTRPTAAADLYSLGMVGFFALTGQLPFAEGSLLDRLQARQTVELPLVRDVNADAPVELAELIDRLLRPDPSERPADADELRDAVADAAAPLDPARAMVVSGGGALPGMRVGSGDSDPLILPGTSGPRSGAVSWNATGSGIGRPPERDDSDASIQFDLPAEPPPDAVEPAPLAAVDTPRGAHAVTQPSTRSRRPSLMLEAGLPASAMSPADPSEAKHVPPPPLATDPRLSIPTPVQWHTSNNPEADPEAVANPESLPADSVLWKKMKRNLLFWQAPKDSLWVSVFGPPAVTPGQTIKLTVYVHQPDAADAVKTLSRAFQHEAELIGTGAVSREVARESRLVIHLSATNAAAAKSQIEVVWHGQPYRVIYELFVPWESPSGAAPGLISVGQNNVRIGKTAFNLHILPR